MAPLPLLAALAWLLLAPGIAVARQGGAPASQPSTTTPTQAAQRPLFQGGLGAMLGVPLGDFADNVTLTGGISGHFDFALGPSPLSAGAEASYLWYGSETRDVPLSGIPDLTVPVETSNGIFLFHGRVRAQKREGRVRPYVDGLVGFNYLITTTSVHADTSCSGSSCSDEDTHSITNLDDLVLSAGGGGGVQIGFGRPPYRARLDLSVRYLYGGEAKYLAEGWIPWDSPVNPLARRSRTDMLLVYAGVAFGR
jgi:hypothetical protein